MPIKPTVMTHDVTPTSVTVQISGDAGVTNRLFYRYWGTLVDITGPTRIGDGQITVNNLQERAYYIYWVVADDGTNLSLPAIGPVGIGTPFTDSILGAMANLGVGSPDLYAAVVATGGGIWVGQEPETVADLAGNMVPTPLPLIVIRDGGSTYDWTFEGSYTEIKTATLHCFAKTAQAAEALQTLVHAVYDWPPNVESPPWRPGLVFTKAQQVSMERTGDILEPTQERAADGEIVFKGSATYKIEVKRAYAN
jgi:hypothetical protein